MRSAFILLSLLAATQSTANTFMPTGEEGGTYNAIGKDIAHIAIPYGLDITVKNSFGSIDNIRQLLKDDEAILSLAQSDVIAALKSSSQTASQSAIKNLRLILPLYQEEVHVLARKNIQSIADLEGKRVGIGRVGSGTHVTATNILHHLQIKAISDNKLGSLDAYKALLFDRLDAVFFVSGKPVSYIQGMLEMNTREDLKALADGIHLLPIEDARLDDFYTKTSIKPSDYVSKNGQYKLTDKTVPTVSVTAALVTKAFPDDNTWITGKRCRQVGKVHRALNKRLPRLASGGSGKNKYHPKWTSVDFKLPIDLEVSDCIETKQAEKKKAAPTTTAPSTQIIAPEPDKVEVPLTAEEVAEAHCLLTTGKPCAANKPLPEAEQLIDAPETATEVTDDSVQAPLP